MAQLRGRLLVRRRRYVLRASTVEHVRVEIEPVGSDDRPQLRVDADLAEDCRVAKRLAHRTPHIGGEVDDSFAAVIKDQAEWTWSPHLSPRTAPPHLGFPLAHDPDYPPPTYVTREGCG
jgi:hypothetical protein